jgi:Mce-associated membrane protein
MFKRSATKDVFDQLLETDALVGGEDKDRSGTAEVAEDELEAAEALTPDDDDPDGAKVAEALETADGTKQLAGTTQDTSRRKRLVCRLAILVGAFAFVATLGLAGVFGWQLKQQNDITAAGSDALNAARTYAVTMTTVDSHKIDDDFARVLDGATGEFKDMYSQSSAQLRQLLIDNKAVSHGTVVDAAIKSATKDKVEVLIFVDQSISNSLNPEPRIDRSRVTMTMELIDNHWLVSNVEIN